MANREGKVYVFDHPLIQHKTALMRDVNTSVKEFRELATEVAMLMGFEATRDLPLEEVDIETPMCKTTVKMLEGEDIAFLCLIAAPEGIDALHKAHPDIDIYIAAKDERLNENAYILPGLGDAGDRLYGTK